MKPVSYTHLDVYKRQIYVLQQTKDFSSTTELYPAPRTFQLTLVIYVFVCVRVCLRAIQMSVQKFVETLYSCPVQLLLYLFYKSPINTVYF